IELTSSRDDGTWTWRAAGAKAPKGTLSGSLLPEGAKVGDVHRADADFFVDGIEITGILPPKGGRQEPERLELVAKPLSDDALVTSSVTARERDDRKPRRDGPRRDRDGGGDRRGGDRDKRRSGGGGGGGDRSESKRDDRPRRSRPEPPPMPVVERPKAKRLRPGKVHRSALLDSLPEEQRPIAEQVVLGGLPAVRQAIEKQNEERAAAGEPAIAAGPLVDMAEKLVPRVRAAEWRDRAEAAQRDLDVLDLRDLRSVVSAADAAAKDEESRTMAQALREGLVARVDAEHTAWLAELVATLDVGRIVRALRVSSRPPKAGAPLPPEVATRLIEGSGAALTADAGAERWVAVLDALAFSPVRDKVIPTSLPVEVHADLQATIARLATRIPKIAHIFEIEPDPTAPRPKPERRRPKKQSKGQQQDQRPKKPKGEKGEKGDKSDEPAVSAPAGTPEDAASAPANPADGPTEAAPAEDAAPVDPTDAPSEAPPGDESAPAEQPAQVEDTAPADESAPAPTDDGAPAESAAPSDEPPAT
ncbi:MAG: hypothetical protein ACSLFP_06170, partial [Acidimicrobiales bacterium]